MLLALSHFDTTFSTRPRGEELRLRVEAAVKAGDPVTIDLSGVLAISYSFADEFAGVLAQHAAASPTPRSLTFVGASADVERVLRRAWRNREAEPRPLLA
jgi:hypothetical protein